MLIKKKYQIRVYNYRLHIFLKYKVKVELNAILKDKLKDFQFISSENDSYTNYSKLFLSSIKEVYSEKNQFSRDSHIPLTDKNSGLVLY